MKRVLFACVLAVCPIVATAQPIHSTIPINPADLVKTLRSHFLSPIAPLGIPAVDDGIPIHGSPQLGAYADPSFWPWVSAQGHWKQPNGMLAHTHVDVRCPIYAEVSAPFTCLFAVKLFHTDGVAYTDPQRQIQVRDIVFDDGQGIATVGDPTGLVVRTGRLTVDPLMNNPSGMPGRGWFVARFTSQTFFANGDTSDLQLLAPFYSMLDPAAAEDPSAFPIAGADFSPHSATTGVAWGNNFVHIFDVLPIAPLFQPMLVRIGTAGYGAVDLSAATYKQLVDLDLHNGVPGSTLDQITVVGDINRDAVIDPTQFGSGPHKMAFTREQPDRNEFAATLLVIDAVGGEGIPPPTICQNPAATNFGGPLPCVFPAPPPTTCTDPAATNFGGPLPCVFPPPVDVWTTQPENPVIQKFGSQDLWRICNAALTHCVALIQP